MDKKDINQLLGEKLMFKLLLLFLVLLPNIGSSQAFTGGDGDGSAQDCLLVPLGSAISITCPTNINVPCQDGTGTIVSWADATATTTCTNGGGCPDNLTGYTHLGESNGSSYFLSTGIEKWVDAQAMAVTAGGHLVVINDASEQAFLESTNFAGIAYIGLYDPNENGNYVWVNGNPLGYTNWDANQPSGGSHHYVATSAWAGYEWDDLNFWTKKNFIIELPCGGGGNSSPAISQISGSANGSLIPGGTTATIVYSATDNCGNSSSCSFTVTVGNCIACTPGTPCDDGDLCTDNDQYDVNCDCAGTPAPNNDGDAYCANIDCNDNNPNLPGTPGTSCNDGNANTENDVITADSCACAGTPISSGCNITYTVTGNDITVTGLNAAHVSMKIFDVDNGWSTSFNCLDNCNNPQTVTLPEGSYYLNVNLWNASWQTTCTLQEYFTVAGNPNPDCNISVVPSTGSVTINGLNAAHVSVQVFNSSWSSVFSCFNNCNNPETINDLPVGTYYFNIKMWNSVWQEICIYQEYHTVTEPAPLEAPKSDYLFFLANKNGRIVNLNWVTNTEYKNAYFIIERSVDKVNFNTINEVLSLYEGYGNRSYQLEDDSPLSGDNYYRVKELFTDGTYRYSEIRKVQFDLDLKEVVVFPNPASTELFINLKSYLGRAADIKINNSLGMLMDQQSFDELPEQPIRFDVRNYAVGVYMVSVVLENRKQKTILFVVSKL